MAGGLTLVGIVGLVGAATCSGRPGTSSGPPNVTNDGGGASEAGTAGAVLAHVFVVAMENENIGAIYGNDTDAPYINGMLIPRFAHATGFTDELAADVPSEAHYVWLEAGTNVFSDHTFTTDDAPSASNSTGSTAHLSTQLTAAGLTWTAYEEGIDTSSGACPVSGSGFYAPQHDPFVFFRDVSGTPPGKTTASCAVHFKELAALAGDLAAGSVAQYVFITPNLCHDMHGADGCPDSDLIRAGDAWLSQAIPAILTFSDTHTAAVFIVWDQGDATRRMPFLALGPTAKAGYESSTVYTHSSVLKTVEEFLGIPVLSTVAAASDLSDLLAPGALP